MKKYVESFHEHSNPGFVLQQKYMDHWEIRMQELPDDIYSSYWAQHILKIIDTIKKNKMWCTTKQYDTVNSLIAELESQTPVEKSESKPVYTVKRKVIDSYWTHIANTYYGNTQKWFKSFLNGLKSRPGDDIEVSDRENRILQMAKRGDLKPEEFSKKS